MGLSNSKKDITEPISPNRGESIIVDTSKTRIFGIPLEETLLRSCHDSSFGKVPTVVYQCIVFINTKGLEEECIYRIPGDKKKIDDIITRYDHGDPVMFLEDYESKKQKHDPLNVARVMLHFLNNLPGGLLTEKFLPNEIKNAIQVDEQLDKTIKREKKIKYLKEIIFSEQFPESNRACLQIITHHLSLIAEHSSKNQMSIKNLVFCVFHMSKYSKTYSTIIKNYHYIF